MLDQGGPRLRALRATLRFEEKFAGRKEKNSIAIEDLFAVLMGLNFAARLTQVLILGQFSNFLFFCDSK